MRVWENCLRCESGRQRAFAGDRWKFAVRRIASADASLCGSRSRRVRGRSGRPLATKHEGAQQRSRIQVLVDSILPAFPDLTRRLSPEERMAQSAECNVRFTVRQIAGSPEGRKSRGRG